MKHVEVCMDIDCKLTDETTLYVNSYKHVNNVNLWGYNVVRIYASVNYAQKWALNC